MNLKTAFFLVGCMLLLFPFKGSSTNGYHALIGCGEDFLAAGSGGRLDWISSKGVVTKSLQVAPVGLNALLRVQQTIVVAGESGCLLISSDAKSFHQVDVGTNSSILSLVQFNNRILAGSEHGLLLVGSEQGLFQSLQLALKGSIVSLSAFETDCYGVTDQGEIIHSIDGNQWTILDFNEYYAGYYRPCRFTSVLVNQHQIAVAGKHDDGTPALFLSAEGSIWAERMLNHTNEQNGYGYLEEIPASMAYDSLDDQLLLVCGKGKIMKIPACSHCNQLITVSTEQLQALCSNGSHWLAVGEEFSIHVLPVGWK